MIRAFLERLGVPHPIRSHDSHRKHNFFKIRSNMHRNIGQHVHCELEVSLTLAIMRIVACGVPVQCGLAPARLHVIPSWTAIAWCLAWVCGRSGWRAGGWAGGWVGGWVCFQFLRLPLLRLFKRTFDGDSPIWGRVIYPKV